MHAQNLNPDFFRIAGLLSPALRVLANTGVLLSTEELDLDLTWPPVGPDVLWQQQRVSTRNLGFLSGYAQEAHRLALNHGALATMVRRLEHDFFYGPVGLRARLGPAQGGPPVTLFAGFAFVHRYGPTLSPPDQPELSTHRWRGSNLVICESIRGLDVFGLSLQVEHLRLTQRFPAVALPPRHTGSSVEWEVLLALQLSLEPHRHSYTSAESL